MLDNLFSVRDKVVLVTGGSRGIGAMIAEAFVRSGARVYITSRKSADCHATAEHLSLLGRCAALPADLAVPGEVPQVVAQLKDSAGRLDVLINNAGMTWGAPLSDYPLDAWDRVFALNVRALFQLTRDLLPLLSAHGTLLDPARVINLGSIAGTSVTRDTFAFAYGASKAAVNHLTRMLAMELVDRHITVNAISPGVFESRMTSHKVGNATMLDIAGRGTPMGRAGTIEDLAGVTLFLASRAGAYLTGTVIPIDGGMHTKPLEWRGEDA